MRRDDFERWSTVVGGFTVAGSFYYYVLFAIVARSNRGQLQAAIHDVLDQRAAAPYQYRVLVPHVLGWLEDHTALSLEQATILVDGVTLWVGLALGLALFRRFSLRLFTFPALLYTAFLMIGLMAYPKPETLTAFACVTAALFALERRPTSEHSWPGGATWPMLVVASVILIGCRTDLLFALSAGFAVRWLRDREHLDLLAAAVLGLTAVISTVALIHIYPAAKYPTDTNLVQLDWSLGPLPLVVAGSFLAGTLGPLALLLRRSDPVESVQRAARAHLPLLGVIAAEFASAVTVGRIDEVRLFFPVVICLLIVGGELWRAMLTPIDAGVLSGE